MVCETDKCKYNNSEEVLCKKQIEYCKDNIKGVTNFGYLCE